MLVTVAFVLFVECTCFTAGTVNGSNVCEPNEEGLCTCKKNVEGLRCMWCKDTYYDLREDNIYGCTGDLLLQNNKHYFHQSLSLIIILKKTANMRHNYNVLKIFQTNN